MDQLIFASLSHTHYWYEVGMLKVPAVVVIYVTKAINTKPLQGIFLFFSKKNQITPRPSEHPPVMGERVPRW